MQKTLEALFLMAVIAAVPLTGCGDDGTEGTGSAGDGDGDGDSDAGVGTDPVYLHIVKVYQPEGTLQYVVAQEELDFDIDIDDLKHAREVAGYTGVASFDGFVVLGDSETPFASKWTIDDDLEWTQVGGELNFTEYFTADEDGLNFYFQLINGNDMLLFYGAERTSRLHWNVDEWKVLEPYEDTSLPAEEGWTLSMAGNRCRVRDYEGPIMQAFTLTNDETGLPSDDSYIAIYDEQTFEEKDVLLIEDCPMLEQASKDEDGALYFSTTDNGPTRALYGEQPPSCVVRVLPDGTVDEDFGKQDMTAWTDGFYGKNFRYMRDGKALINVLYDDRIEGADFDGELDPEVHSAIDGNYTEETGYTPPDPSLWELHLVDLEAGTSKLVTGIADEHDMAGYTDSLTIDGRVFVYAMFEAESTFNAVYEIDLDTAEATLVGQISGDAWGVERLR